MSFKIIPVERSTFDELLKLGPEALARRKCELLIADEEPGYPCRISLVDAKIGEEVILLNYEDHDCKTPYKTKGPIYIRRKAEAAELKKNEVPGFFKHRLLSIRGFNASGTMLSATVTQGTKLRQTLISMFKDSRINYIHVHNAKPGCYMCKVIRA